LGFPSFPKRETQNFTLFFFPRGFFFSFLTSPKFFPGKAGLGYLGRAKIWFTLRPWGEIFGPQFFRGPTPNFFPKKCPLGNFFFPTTGLGVKAPPSFSQEKCGVFLTPPFGKGLFPGGHIRKKRGLRRFWGIYPERAFGKIFLFGGA